MRRRSIRSAHPGATRAASQSEPDKLPTQPMHLDWTAFTPWPALAGGALIGLATAIYLLGSGRIAGIAGIVGDAWQSLWRGTAHESTPRWGFLLGLAVSPWLWQLAMPLPAMHQNTATLGLVLAGILVGVGVRMGRGCTSGHGVCGLSRLSPRSLVSVLAFMGMGMLVVAAMRAASGNLA